MAVVPIVAAPPLLNHIMIPTDAPVDMVGMTTIVLKRDYLSLIWSAW